MDTASTHSIHRVHGAHNIALAAAAKTPKRKNLFEKSHFFCYFVRSSFFRFSNVCCVPQSNALMSNVQEVEGIEDHKTQKKLVYREQNS